MSAFKPQQRHLAMGGRNFHFVSYEAQVPNARRGEPGSPPMWCLMVEGRRCPVLSYDPAQSLEDVDIALAKWVRANALADDDGSDASSESTTTDAAVST